MSIKREYIDLRNDGRIMLFKRVEVGDKFYVRLKIKGNRGYKTVSCKTKNRVEAERIAYDLYDELSLKVLNGQRINSVLFKNVVNEWSNYRTNSYKDGAKDGQIERVKSYCLDYFGERKIDEIKESDFLDYWNWRRKNFRRKEPSDGTLNRERTSIKSVFNYAYMKGYVKSNLKIEKIRVKKDNRRASFTDGEWKKITIGMRNWVKEGKKVGAWRDRFLFQQYVLIMSNSGMRIGEARNLKWEDMSVIELDGDKLIKLLISGKTGMREVICNKGCEVYFKRLYDLRNEELGEAGKELSNKEVIFYNKRSGGAVGSFRKSFYSMMEFCGVDIERNSELRSIYSLRHFYATKRLKGGANVYMLAKQMGTSVEMIENFYGHVLSEDIARNLTKSSNQKMVNDDLVNLFEGIKNSTN